jgi:HlyD family secretion protein
VSAPDLRVVVPGPGRQAVPAAQPSTTPVRASWLRRHWVFAALVVLIAAAAAVQWQRTSSAAIATPHYTTAPVTRGAVMRTVTASGSVNPVTTIQVGTYVSGPIQELYCDYNTVVRKGQRCAKIDPRPYQTVVAQDRANFATAKAQLGKDETGLAYAKLTYERTVDLRQQGIVSQDAFDSARSAFDQAQAQVELDKSNIDQRRAALSASEINLAYTNIVSPVDGTVISRNVTMGQTVAASFQTPTLFLIATDLTKMQVDANVSESDIGGIKAGNAATFTIDAFPKRVFEGRVSQLRQAPQTVQNVVTYDVVISVPNPDLLLMPGMTATARIIIDRRDDVLRVPATALRFTPGGLPAAATAVAGAARAKTGATPQVWVLRDGRPLAVPVTTGLDDDTNAEIVTGDLKAGDEVITAEQASSGSAQGRLPMFRL